MIQRKGMQPRSNRGLSNDAFEYEKRGRLLRDELARESVRRRTAQLLSTEARGYHSGIAAASSQSDSGGSGLSKARSRETVLKVVNWTKTRRSPLTQAKYASHTGAGDDPSTALAMWNEKGETLIGPQIERELLSWELAPESRNLSAAAKKLPEPARAQLSVDERLAKRQAAHVIFSVPSDAKSDAQRLGKAVDASLQETVAVAGFRYVYTIHTEHGRRPHAHVIIKAASEPFGRDGRKATRQLRLGPKELEAMRQVFTRQCQQQGLNVVATRREDRGALRADILAGRASLRENMNLHQAMKQTRQGRNFERSAPEWYKEHGFDYERRRLRAASVAPTPSAPGTIVSTPESPAEDRTGILGRVLNWGRSKVNAPAMLATDEHEPAARSRQPGFFKNFKNYRRGILPAALNHPPPPSQADIRLVAQFTATTRDPTAAMESFKAMARELQSRGRGVGLALWAANNHPIAFGDPTGAAGPGLKRNDVADILRASTPHSGRLESEARRAPSFDPIARAQQLALAEATRHARAERRATELLPRVARSLELHAGRVERETPTDPYATEQAMHIRAIAQSLVPGNGRPRQEPERPQMTARDEDKVRRYTELHEQIARRDQARSRTERRLDPNDHGRSR